MNKFVFLFCVLLVGCASKTSTTNLPTPSFSGKFRESCVPEAAAMVEGLKKYNIQAKVVLFQYSNIKSPRGHAIAVYFYPPGANQMWGWDSWWGSTRLRAWWWDPLSIAKAWGQKTGQIPVFKAEEF